MKKLALLIITVGLISCEGVVEPEPENWDVQVKGIVTDSETQESIDSVKVYLWKWDGSASYYNGQYYFHNSRKTLCTTFSDSAGNYSLNYTVREVDFPSGMITIYAQASKEAYGLDTYHKNFRISEQGITIMNFELRKY